MLSFTSGLFVNVTFYIISISFLKENVNQLRMQAFINKTVLDNNLPPNGTVHIF